MFFLKKTLTALVLPPFGLILFAVYGLWILRRYPRVGRSVVGFSLLTLGVLSLPLVADVLIRSLEKQPPISANSLARAQAIVILGGGNYSAAPEYDGDTVSRSSLERARYGVHLQRLSGLPILVAGGAPLGGRTEGETLKDVIERDFRGEVKWVEGLSRDTAENAANSGIMLKSAGLTRIALVSHSWHLTRASELFRREGLEVFSAPTGFTTHSASFFAQILPSAVSLAQSSGALQEWLGIFVQRLSSGVAK